MNVLSFGYDTGLLLPEDPQNESQYRQKRYCELLDQHRAFVILMDQPTYNERSLADGKIWSVSAIGQNGWTQIAEASAQAGRVCRLFRPDVVEYQDPLIAGSAAYWTAKKLRVPLAGGVFNDFVDSEFWLRGGFQRLLYNAAGRFVLARTARVRCDSRETAGALNQKGFTQVEYIPFYVPWLERFAVDEKVQRKRQSQWQDMPTVLCVARLAAEKNMALLLHAFGRAVSSCKRGRLIIVGSGPLEDQLKNLAVELGISDRVIWRGAVDYACLPRYYRDASLFALASDSETSARVLIMAQASHLPTISTDTSGSRDIVKDGTTGYVTPIGDAATFDVRLRELLSDEHTYNRMLYADGYDAFDQHGEAVITRRLKAFYNKVVGTHPAR
jgi:glycosyltransferase involved in cell wall biosynthesis